MEFKIEHKEFNLSFNLDFKGDISLDGLFNSLTIAEREVMSKYSDDIWQTLKLYDLYDIRRGILNHLLIALLEYEISNQNKLLYFLEAENGLIKVGITNDIRRRVNQLQNQLDTKIRVLKLLDGKSAYEKIIHNLYSDDNIIYKGQTEWFHPTHKLIRFISNIDEKNIGKLCQGR
jgi:hypothetical protein